MLSFKEYVLEARKNPELNPKVSINQEIITALKNSKDIIAEVNNLFCSFTEIEKLGINPQSQYDTPIGIYSYPAQYIVRHIGEKSSMANLPFAGEPEKSPYVNIFKVSGNIINLSKHLNYDPYYKKIIEYLIKKINISEMQADEIVGNIIDRSKRDSKFSDYSGGKFWYVTMEVSEFIAKKKNQKVPVAWNSLFRAIGIDGFIDPGIGIIHNLEPTQAVFFSKEIIKDNKRVYNKFSPENIKSSIEQGKENLQKKKELSKMSKDELTKYIEKNPSYIQYIKNPSEELQYSVIEKNIFGILYIKNPSEDMQIKGIEDFSSNIQFIKNPTLKVQLIAIEDDPFNIRYIKNPTEDIQIKAMKKNPSVFNLIENPTDKVKKLAKSKEANKI